MAVDGRVINEVILLANIICLFGTLLQIYQVIKNKNMLKGYSFTGSLLTFISVFMFDVGFWMLEQYLSTAIGAVTVIYWMLVTIYTGHPKTKKSVEENREIKALKELGMFKR